MSKAKSGDLISSSLAARVRFTHPGYKEEIEGSGTPAGAYFQPPHRRQVYAVCANHLLRARLALKRSALAYRRSTAALTAAN
jgi:hypothetical protein